VLMHLSHSEDKMKRRVDLASRIQLTATGITRQHVGLERSGCVCKETCDSDARVSYAKLTDAGSHYLREAAVTHLRGIDELFTSRYAGSELATLAELLSRLPTTGEACKSPGPPCS
jgi:DNA-binding MarR family transcriptional regulator